MAELTRYEKLLTIGVLRDIIRSWWGVELAFADARGYVLEHGRGNIIPPQNDYCRASLFSKEGFRRCNESVREISGKLTVPAPGSRRAVTHLCHLGFTLVSCPIKLDGVLAGFVFVGGSAREALSPSTQSELDVMLRDVDADPTELASPRRVPVLDESSLEQLLDLLELAADEVQNYHAETSERDREISHLSRELGRRYRFDNIIGTSRPMQDVFRLLEKVIESESTVLINGESGTGKELIARAIHYNGPRARKPFVVQNCSAFNDNLLESALFGHTKGAFTGAVRDKKGLFGVAHTGTFFLDEIGDMSPALQTKLLRVLEEGTFTPVGSTETRQVDVRVIAATHKDLQKMVESGDFREDLYYRINVIRVLLPPLRERLDDLPLLVDHFLRKHHRGKGALPRLDDGLVEAMSGYGWPGNIRELENEIERLLVLGGDQEVLLPELLSARITEARNGASRQLGRVPAQGTLRAAVEALERDMLRQGLIRTHWNKSKLSKDLGISRSNLILKLERYGLDRKGSA